MPKALCILGIVIAFLLGLLFLLDLAFFHMAGKEMRTMSTIMDLGFLVCAVILGYVSWSTWRDQR